MTTLAVASVRADGSIVMRIKLVQAAAAILFGIGLATAAHAQKTSGVMAPTYTIQGGTTQVLRGIVARGLGLR